MSPVGEVKHIHKIQRSIKSRRMINVPVKNLLDTTSHLHFVNKNGKKIMKICLYLTDRFECLRLHGLIWGSDRSNRGLI